jgi:hypothetical protein
MLSHCYTWPGAKVEEAPEEERQPIHVCFTAERLNILIS